MRRPFTFATPVVRRSSCPSTFSAGSEQEYVEDSPVCCCPNVIHVEVDEDGDVRVWAKRE
jgi:hypothetical protein